MHGSHWLDVKNGFWELGSPVAELARDFAGLVDVEVVFDDAPIFDLMFFPDGFGDDSGVTDLEYAARRGGSEEPDRPVLRYAPGFELWQCRYRARVGSGARRPKRWIAARGYRVGPELWRVAWAPPGPVEDVAAGLLAARIVATVRTVAARRALPAPRWVKGRLPTPRPWPRVDVAVVAELAQLGHEQLEQIPLVGIAPAVAP